MKWQASTSNAQRKGSHLLYLRRTSQVRSTPPEACCCTSRPLRGHCASQSNRHPSQPRASIIPESAPLSFPVNSTPPPPVGMGVGEPRSPSPVCSRSSVDRVTSLSLASFPCCSVQTPIHAVTCTRNPFLPAASSTHLYKQFYFPAHLLMSIQVISTP